MGITVRRESQEVAEQLGESAGRAAKVGFSISAGFGFA